VNEEKYKEKMQEASTRREQALMIANIWEGKPQAYEELLTTWASESEATDNAQ
jgi:hypothetical protein